MSRSKILMLSSAFALCASLSPAVAQDAPLEIVFVHHSSASNTFWQAVQRGFEDACERVQANCQMVFTQTEGSVEQQVANLQAGLARDPDAVLTSIVDDAALDSILAEARANGVTVIGVNVDDSEGAAGSPRQAFIGQGFVPAGYSLGQAMSDFFPDDGPVHVLMGVSAPGQNWSEQRASGVMNFIDDYADANPDRDVTLERIDSGTDLATTADRVGAYLNANPETTVYFDTGFWHAAVARALRDMGREPGDVLLGGFDLVPEVLREMQSGYVQVQVDQQPYMQGFIPVMQVYLAENFGLAPTDVDTGQGIILQGDVDQILDLSAQGLR